MEKNNVMKEAIKRTGVVTNYYGKKRLKSADLFPHCGNGAETYTDQVNGARISKASAKALGIVK